MSARAFDHHDAVLRGSDDTPSRVTVTTEQLLPVVSTTRRCKFVLPTTGTLDAANSALRVPILVTGAPDGAFLPAGAGIYSAIESATLSFNNQRIQSFRDLAFYRSMTNSFDTPDYRHGIRRITEGVNTCVVPTQVQSHVASGVAGATGNAAFGRLMPAGANVDKVNPSKMLLPESMALTSSASTTPQWTVMLSDLFPLLKDVSIPLYALDSPLVIDIEWKAQLSSADIDSQTNGNGVVAVIINGVANAGAIATVSTEQIEMYIDTITFDDVREAERLERMNAEKGFSMPYETYISSVSQIPSLSPPPVAPAISTQGIFNTVPVAGNTLKSLLFASNAPDQPGSTPRYSNTMFGKYAMTAPFGGESFDLRANDSLLFPSPITSVTEKATELSMIYGSPVCLTPAMFSYDVTVQKGTVTRPPGFNSVPVDQQFPTINTADFQFYGPGIVLSDALTGQQSFTGAQLSEGIGDSNEMGMHLSNQKGLEVLLQRARTATDNFKLSNHYFAHIVQHFGIKGGQILIMQQPGSAMA